MFLTMISIDPINPVINNPKSSIIPKEIAAQKPWNVQASGIAKT